IKTAQELGLPPAIMDMIDCDRGLILVTGPTGSGKSTTLAAMIHQINMTRETHIITVEDPIEFVHPTLKSLVNQRDVGSHT
ncbi:MAG: ATPase, T2SS/T4P/T4SS family, partial [Bdellovibrio sp.]